jgi:uroporphyrinogen-III decarboxylase
MAILTKRERVMRAVRFEETDRTPVYDILQNDAVIEHYAGETLSVAQGDRVKAKAIGRVLDLTRMPEGPAQPHVERNEQGLLLQIEPWTSWIIERPFHDGPSLREWVKDDIRRSEQQVFDRAYAERFHQRIRDAQALFAQADPTGRKDPTLMIVESGVGLTEAYWMAGMEEFSYLCADEPELVDEWLEARNQAELRRVAAIADPALIPLALTYDDIAFKTSTLFSPAWLRRYWVPRLRRLVAAWHARDTLCIYHSDGNLWPILDDLVACGIDGLNPLETLAGMTVQAVRQRYPRLALTGGIDVSQLLVYGTPDEVRAECRKAIAAAAGRGYLIGSSTELHWDVKLENAIAMFETAWQTPC